MPVRLFMAWAAEGPIVVGSTLILTGELGSPRQGPALYRAVRPFFKRHDAALVRTLYGIHCTLLRDPLHGNPFIAAISRATGAGP